MFSGLKEFFFQFALAFSEEEKSAERLSGASLCLYHWPVLVAWRLAFALTTAYDWAQGGAVSQATRKNLSREKAIGDKFVL